MNTQPAPTIETLARRLKAVRTLRDYKIGAKREPHREAWLRALLRIVEPWMGSGRPVPIGEIVVDARWGALARGPGGWTPPELHSNRGHDCSRTLVDVEYWDAVDPLTNIPEDEISPLIAACVASLELTHGPMQLVLPDMDKPEDVTRVRKFLLHTPSHNEWALEAVTGRRRKSGGWLPREVRYRQDRAIAQWWWRQDHPEAPGGLLPPMDWRGYTAELAEAAGLPHPDLLSRLHEWLHPTLRQRPDWLRDH